MGQGVDNQICPIGELIDKLSIENIKCHFFNHKIKEEQAKPRPDNDKIAALLANSQEAGEQRVRLRDAINKAIAGAVAKGHLEYVSSVARTYHA